MQKEKQWKKSKEEKPLRKNKKKKIDLRLLVKTLQLL